MKPYQTDFSKDFIHTIKQNSAYAKPLHVLITGSQDRGDANDESYALVFLQTVMGMGYAPVIYDGGMKNGADRMAERLSISCLLEHYIRPINADWATMSDEECWKEITESNQDLVDACPPGSGTVCLAFPGKGASKGTWDLVNRAEEAGFRTFIFNVPDEKGVLTMYRKSPKVME